MAAKNRGKDLNMETETKRHQRNTFPVSETKKRNGGAWSHMLLSAELYLQSFDVLLKWLKKTIDASWERFCSLTVPLSHRTMTAERSWAELSGRFHIRFSEWGYIMHLLRLSIVGNWACSTSNCHPEGKRGFADVTESLLMPAEEWWWSETNCPTYIQIFSRDFKLHPIS